MSLSDWRKKLGSEKLLFFTQSGWMLIAGALGAVFLYGASILANKALSPDQWSLYQTFLNSLNYILNIPAIGLLTIIIQQTAAAVQPIEKEKLRSTVRGILFVIFLLWASLAGLVAIFQPAVLHYLKTDSASGLWIMMFVALLSLWQPVILGLLQGSQNFGWAGGATAISGLGRFVGVVVFVSILLPTATVGLLGVLLGIVFGLGIGFWQTRPFLRRSDTAFEWRPLLKRVLPLTLGLGAPQFIMGFDMLVLRPVFGKDASFYATASQYGKAAVPFAGMVALVMFPKIVRSNAMRQKSSVMNQTLLVTAVIMAAAALPLTLFPGLILRVASKPEYLPAIPLIQLFPWCVLPFSIANVLINTMLAKEDYRCVPWLVGVAAAYGFSINWLARSLVGRVPPLEASSRILLLLGAFSVILFIVSFLFYRRQPAGKQS